MTSQISPNRMEISDRFTVGGFTILTDPSHPWFEVALATDPTYFKFENRAKRTHATFFSTRAMGALPTERGEAVFLVPPEVLSGFIGQQKLYYALATFATPARTQPNIAFVPTATSPWINLQGFTGRTLRRVVGVPNPRGGLEGRAGAYAGSASDTLIWAGDDARPGVEAAPPVVGQPVPAGSAPLAASTPTTARAPVAATSALAYDDGFDPALWSQPMSAGGEDDDVYQEQPAAARYHDGPLPVTSSAYDSAYESDSGEPLMDAAYASAIMSDSGDALLDGFASEDAHLQTRAAAPSTASAFADALELEDTEPPVAPALSWEDSPDSGPYASADAFADMLSVETPIDVDAESLGDAEMVSAVPGTILARTSGGFDGVTWELDQLHGMKQVASNGTHDAATLAQASLGVEGPVLHDADGDEATSADFEIRWQHDGRSLGNVEIANVRGRSTERSKLHVKASISDAPGVFTTTPPSDTRFAGLKVLFTYHFTRAAAPAVHAESEVTLYGNGTASVMHRWPRG